MLGCIEGLTCDQRRMKIPSSVILIRDLSHKVTVSLGLGEARLTGNIFRVLKHVQGVYAYY